MRHVTSLDAARDALAELADLWPLLAETRIPGTPPPWRPPELTAEQRAVRDHQARLDRLDTDAIGWSAAPLHLAVVDVLTDLAAELGELADVIADGAGAAAPVMSSALSDPRPLLAWCRTALGDADADTVAYVADRAAAMRRTVERRTADVWDGMRLPIVCPWCRGVTPYAPAGGEHTWRMRMLPGSPQTVPAIVCESGVCEPPERDVGTWWRGRPCWPVPEWEWLARRVEAAGAA